VPTVKADELRDLTARLFAAIGTPPEEARWIAHLMVLSNLRGHDSHGVIRIPQYIRSARAGESDPTARVEVLRETPSLALLDGHWGFGHVVARDAMEIALAKAARNGLAAVTIRRCKHVGRLADYCEMAVKRGFIAMLAVNAGGEGQSVAPHGGLARRLSTNPIAFGIPTGSQPPILLDLATSVVAQGKLRVKYARKEKTGEGWIIDAQGAPTTDPAKYYEAPRGAMLPMAGPKGYGLALVVEVLGGILSGAGYSTDRPAIIQNGVFILALDPAQFLPRDEYLGAVDEMISYVKSSPPAQGFTAILVPGEPEELKARQLERDGIFVEESTWSQIRMLAAELGLGCAGDLGSSEYDRRSWEQE
jgi:uncharacterized oxidoreductase